MLHLVIGYLAKHFGKVGDPTEEPGMKTRVGNCVSPDHWIPGSRACPPLLKERSQGCCLWKRCRSDSRAWNANEGR